MHEHIFLELDLQRMRLKHYLRYFLSTPENLHVFFPANRINLIVFHLHVISYRLKIKIRSMLNRLNGLIIHA